MARRRLMDLVTVLCLGSWVACGGGGAPEDRDPADTAGDERAAGDGPRLSGAVRGDGSSTVFPIMEAVSEEFQKENPGVRVTVGISGTGGGFKKFCAGETDLSNASRPIKETELEACRAAGVDFVELPIAFDGLSVLANPANDFAQCMTLPELKKLWQPEAQGKVMRWNQVRAAWPAQEIHLYGAGTDSGTYDYFTEAVVGEEGASRGDFTSSEDDNVIVQGISGDPRGLGFFGYAYYEQNKDRLKLLEVDGGDGCVAPSPETIANGTYKPLSRPLFIYVRTTALDRPEVKAFIDYAITNATSLVAETGYIPLTDELYRLARTRAGKRTPGSIYEGGGSQAGTRLQDLLEAEEAGAGGDDTGPDGTVRGDSAAA
ncbi:MAG: PstS family phosphate ABC transporter substrate-binding protein [Gemmatimonadetes bacterium]|nr:PstS family phosphate ABC transporter substrate-binding protein [Gemmatimonadota bacterium]